MGHARTRIVRKVSVFYFCFIVCGILCCPILFVILIVIKIYYILLTITTTTMQQSILLTITTKFKGTIEHKNICYYKFVSVYILNKNIAFKQYL